MANEVDITVKSTDKTDFGGITRDTKSKFSKVGDESGKSFGASIKKWFTKGGDESGKSFGGAIKKWFTGEGGGLLTELGKSGGTVFGSGLLGALKTPILGPALLAAFAAVTATVMPAVGAIAGGALVTGFGAGIAGLGLVFAAKSEAVKAVWSKTMSQLGADMKLLSKPFESTLINIAGTFQRTVDKFNPALAKAFSKMSGPISTFVDQAGQALEQLIPAIDPITNAFNGVLGALGPALKTAIGDIATGMTDLANSVAQNPTALADMVTGLGAITKTTLGLITTLNDVNNKFSTMTGGLSLVTVVFKGIEEIVRSISAPFAGLAGIIGGFNAMIGKTGKDSDGAGKSMADAANKTALLAAGLGGVGTQAQNGVVPTQTLAEKIQAAGGTAAYAKQQLEGYISSMFKLQNLSLGLSGAQINLQAAIDNASAAVTANGKATDINTDKGRANKTALDGIASSANAQTEAMLRSGKGVRTAANTADDARATFVALAQKMGYTKGQADAMAKSMIAIPKKTETDFKADISDLNAKIAAAKKKLADKSLTATKRAKLEATIAQLLAAKKQAQSAIDALHGKTVTVTMKLNSANVQQKVNNQLPAGVGLGRRTGGQVRGFASGGNPTPGRFLVGEEGPEFLDLSGGVGRVTPASNTRQQLAQGGGGAVKVVLEIRSDGRSRYADFLVEELRKFVKVSYGGNVQTALGQG